MTLIFLIACLLTIIFWISVKDRRYLKKNLKEVLSPAMKHELNLPDAHNEFSKTLEETRKKRTPPPH